MSEVAYLDQSTLLAKCYAEKSYVFLREKILQEHTNCTKTIHQNGEIYGYTIALNQPLTELYHFPCYVARLTHYTVKTRKKLCASYVRL